MNKSSKIIGILLAFGLFTVGCPDNGDDADTGTDDGEPDAMDQMDADEGDTDEEPDDAGDEGDADEGDADEGADDAGEGDADEGDTDEGDAGETTASVTMTVGDASYLPQLGDNAEYEGWLVTDDEPVSTGTFSVSADQTEVTFEDIPQSTIDAANKFVLTIEEPEQEGPSDVKYLSGDISDGSADLDITGVIGDFSGLNGGYILNAPTADDPAGSYNNGIWFLDSSGDSAASAFADGLPSLDGKGWVYEGWVVDTTGPTPTTTGKFDKSQDADSWTVRDIDGAGPSCGPNTDGDCSQAGPDFPGQDFVSGDNEFDLQSGDYKVVLSVEPQPDTSDAPFPIKPYSANIDTDVGQSDFVELSPKTDSLPTGSITIE